MTLDASGNLGIGTSSPAVKLQVKADIPLRFNNAAGSNEAQFEFLDAGATLRLYSFYATGSNLSFYTNANGGGVTERMRINSSGKVLVGTSTSITTNNGESPFTQTAGTDSRWSYQVATFANTAATQGGLFLAKSRGTSVGSYTAVQSGDNLGRIGWSGADGTTMTSQAAEIIAQVDGSVSTGIVPGRLVFNTSNTSGVSAERMRIDSSGNVGIGCTNPAYRLDVASGSTFGYAARFRADGTNGIAYLQFTNAAANVERSVFGAYDNIHNIWRTTDGATAIPNDCRFGINGGPLNVKSVTVAGAESTDWPVPVLSTSSVSDYQAQTVLAFLLRDDAAYMTDSSKWNFRLWGVTNKYTSDSSVNLHLSGPGDLAFGAGGASEKMRLDSSGNLLVGTTSTYGQKLSVNGGFTFSDSTGTYAFSAFNLYGNYAYTGGATEYIPADYYFGGGYKGSIRVNASGVSYTSVSDYRLKENIQPMTNALGVVNQLNPVTYTWKTDGSDGQGFIAHELQAVVPDCVTGEKDAVDEEGKPVYQGIDTSFLVATLTKAIQELKAELDATKAEVAALKGA